MQVYEFSKENLYEVIIVGGGTCGLATAARLCENHPASIYTEDEHQRFHWLRQRGNKVNLISRGFKNKEVYQPQKRYTPDEILVLDEVEDSWLGQWKRQFKTCQIPYLRSPMFFHPDPVNYDALVTYTYLNGREKDLKEVENVVGKEYSKHKLKKQRAKSMKKVPAPSGSNKSHNSPGIIDINMRDWKDYYRPSTPLFESFCQDVVDRYNLSNVVKKDSVVSIEYCYININDNNEAGKGFVIKTKSGQIYCSKACVVASGHVGKINYPIQPFIGHNLEAICHTSHIFSKEVDSFPHPRVMSKIKDKKETTLVVVGGGLTAAQLSHVAINSGVTKVYQILRGPLKIKHFDFHLDWVTKYKNVKKSAFYILDSDEERWNMIQDAREGGSVNPEYYKILQKHCKSGKLELLRFSSITSQSWDEETKTWNLVVETKSHKFNSEVEGKPQEIHINNVDYIVCATGISACVDKLPFLESIQKEHPIRFIHGLPCLTDNLQWNEQMPLFMIGKNAMLRMGPSSANLDGARLGADRIGWYLQEMRAKGEFQWSNCSENCVCDLEDNEDQASLLSDASNQSSVSSVEEIPSSFDARMKLATGELNWFSLLDEE